MKKVIVLIGMGLAAISCKTPVFSKAEKALINEASAETAFRILQVTGRQDSVLLRTPCAGLNYFANDPTLRRLVARMKTTLLTGNGVGIAAPQVGISRNIFLFMRLDLPGEPIVTAINPKIVNHPDTTICFERDGCLSIPNFQGNSIRYPWVEVEYYNEKGELIRERLEGYSRHDTFTSIIFQHEYDHLQGILFTDKLCEE
ncbi:MAG: peptide deformylase [Tannerellaceae bacterium]|jgi:peptide deformylase|nr:peptide deformylase [Tannerellaceae bacterium]